MNYSIMRLAYIIHIANYPIFLNILSSLKRNNIKDNNAFINVCRELISPSQELMIKSLCDNIFNEVKYFFFPNKGSDIGPFIKILNYLIKNNKEYDLIFKIHTKTRNNWRRELIEPFMDNMEKIKYLFKNISNLGIICSQYWLFLLDDLNKKNIDEFIKTYNLKTKPYINSQNDKNLDILTIKKYNSFFYNSIIKEFGEYRNDIYNEEEILDWIIDNRKKHTVINENNKPDEIYFVAGTIFVIKFSLIKDFIRKYNIDLEKEYDKLEKGYILNNQETYVHTWERILSGIIIKEMNHMWLSI